MALRIVHTADWHLSNRGTLAGRFVLSQGINLTLLDRVLALNRIVEYVKENGADLITIPGDIFDHHDPEDVAIDVAVTAIESLSEQAPVVIVKGNHEGGKASEASNALASLKQRPGVSLFETPGILPIVVKDQRIKVFALPYPKKPSPKSDPALNGMSPEEISIFVSQKLEEVLTGFQAGIDRDAINILVGHFSVTGSIYGKDQQIPPFDISVRKEFLQPFDLVCLGHLHASQPFYSGTIARGGFGDEGIPVGFKVYIVDREPPWVPTISESFIELPGREYQTFSPGDFLKDLDGLNLEACIRVKGKVLRPDYDAVIRKARSLNLPFFKNAMEVQMEAVGTGDGVDVSEEPDLGQAIKLWATDREGVDKFLDRMIEAGQEIEEKYNEVQK